MTAVALVPWWWIFPAIFIGSACGVLVFALLVVSRDDR
jgi:hypothetical protein